MNSFSRLVPYIWPHRRIVGLSVFFAVLVAILWGMNLTAAYPVVKVLLNKESLGEYVEREIAAATRESEMRAARLKRIEALLKDLDEPRDVVLTRLRADQAESQSRADEAESRLARLDDLLKEPGQAADFDELLAEQADLRTRLSDDAARLRDLETQIAAVEGEGSPEDQRVKLLGDQADQQTKLTEAARQLVLFNWLKANLLPWLPADQFDLLAIILAVLLGATLLKGICLFIQEVLVGNVVERICMDLRKDCFRRTLRLDYQTLHIAGTPDLMSRFTYDVQVLSDGLTLLGGKIIREPLKMTACVVIAFYVNWRLMLLSLVFAPLAGFVFYRIGRKLKGASHRLMESMSRIYKTLEETFAGLKVVIAFGNARKHRVRFHRENKEYFSKMLRLVRIDSLTSPVTELLGVFAAFVSLLPGAYLVLRGTHSIWGVRLSSSVMTIEQLALLYAMLAGMIDPARKLSTAYAKVKRASAAADRLFAHMDRKSLVAQAAEPRLLPRHKSSIDFRHVTFTYAGRPDELHTRSAVLQDVSLKVKGGEVIVVVGGNGSGKSTLVNLLPRFYDPDSGTVMIDGVNIRDVRLRDLRAQISVVTQETLLFDETIYENIRYGKPSATRDEILAAACKAHVTPFVEQFPEGFDTRVGEKGGRLSGGQRQRIALARAMLRDPSILILDEATSAVDSQSELLIHQALRQFVQGRTVFLITHTVSQSILDFVTRIAVMDQGRLIAVGPHETLLETCPVYQTLFHSRAHGKPDDATSDRTSWDGSAAA